MSAYLLLCASLAFAVAIVGAAAQSSSTTILYFNIVVNMTEYNSNTTSFVSAIASEVGAATNTVLVVTSINVSASDVVALDSLCVSSNTSVSMTTSTNVTSNATFAQFNLTFVGTVASATASSTALNALSLTRACALGLLWMESNASTASNDPVSLTITLLSGVTAQQFVASLAALLGVSTSVFEISNVVAASSTSSRTFRALDVAGGTFTLTIVGANPSALQDVVLNLSPAELAAIGASGAASVPTSSTTATNDDSDSHVGIIIGSVVGGVAFLIIVTVIIVKCCCSKDAKVHDAEYSEMQHQHTHLPNTNAQRDNSARSSTKKSKLGQEAV
ncbi:membrane-associated protein, putative [Bodo saltans]|uniref:Membrane-associated protein, putative n=1 Tax=Bodo saltans TaxID=75058 RepID=A0A0S4ITJ6_BODSA|nr:membrane-associated protein, putative [Bodo saltans]|eukprot:CUF87746.1 membrane-associated protein, putative [Bodo saltans]